MPLLSTEQTPHRAKQQKQKARLSPRLRMAFSLGARLNGVVKLLFFSCMLLFTNQGKAGLTGCDVVVVVNGDSSDSRTVANHYIKLRDIPANNVVVLRDIPEGERISVEDFRKKILKPLIETLDARKVSRHVQCIAYSAGFPTAVDISADLKKVKNLPRIYTPVGSINGLTTLYQQVLAGNPNYIGLTSNFYARRKLDEVLATNPGGDATLQQWKEIQELVAAKEHKQAKEALLELAVKIPEQYPLLYLAAAQAALEGEKQQAIALLNQAFRFGWTSGDYLVEDPRFESLKDEPAFQTFEYAKSDEKDFLPPVPFDALQRYGPNGIQVKPKSPGQNFLMSIVLAVTRPPGNSLAEAIEGMERSAGADFTHPEGSFYFCLTKDVRTTTRKWAFDSVIEQLQELGFDAEIVEQTLPANKNNVLGVQSGAPNYNWAISRSEFVPGALADNLTSFGGQLRVGSSQTKLTQFLRGGAAGSSGTVTEPFAIQNKFPLPHMYLYYAQGASLAEAFHLSVAGPYQLLIMGDPVCQPFSHAPKQGISSDIRYLSATGSLELELDLKGASYFEWVDENAGNAAASKEFLRPQTKKVLLNGVTHEVSVAEKSFTFGSVGRPAGYHEIRLRLSADDPLEQSSQVVIPVWIGEKDSVGLRIASNAGKRVEKAGRSYLEVRKDLDSLEVKLEAPGAERISLWNNWEQIAMRDGESGILNVDLDKLGSGPVRLQARAETQSGEMIRGMPTWLILP